MRMKTLNVRVSKETLDKLESLKQFGKGKVVSVAILDLSLERLLGILQSQVKTKSKKSPDKKKST